jgi:hypothetical protein
MAAVHGGSTPQPQRPSGSQVLVIPAGQVRHVEPPMPHAAATGVVMHVRFAQQPVQLSQPDMGAARVTVTGRSRPLTTTTRAEPEPATAPPESPSTEISRVRWSSASGRSTRTVEVLARGPPAVSGRSAGPKMTSVPSSPV